MRRHQGRRQRSDSDRCKGRHWADAAVPRWFGGGGNYVCFRACVAPTRRLSRPVAPTSRLTTVWRASRGTGDSPAGDLEAPLVRPSVTAVELFAFFLDSGCGVCGLCCAWSRRADRYNYLDGSGVLVLRAIGDSFISTLSEYESHYVLHYVKSLHIVRCELHYEAAGFIMKLVMRV